MRQQEYRLKVQVHAQGDKSHMYHHEHDQVLVRVQLLQKSMQ